MSDGRAQAYDRLTRRLEWPMVALAFVARPEVTRAAGRRVETFWYRVGRRSAGRIAP